MIANLVYLLVILGHVLCKSTTTVHDVLRQHYHRQSPIDIDTLRRYSADEMITSDPSFGYYYGKVSKSHMVTPNNGTSLQFNIGEEKHEYFRTSVVSKWYPEIKSMEF